MVFQVITFLLVLVFCLIMIGHIKDAWYDLTHMDEYRERVAYKRELRQVKKDAEIQVNNEADKNFEETGQMF